ncbi:MAG: hypothetical protein IIY73_07170 [Solobacterium sp.]|nr:hypothetical protein [Solobacterium sp.]
MKTIVCFGDSNTWGYMPKKEEPFVTAANRFPWNVRWPGVLQEKLGPAYRIVEEGLNGRTTAFECPMEENRSGLQEIGICLEIQTPVDLVIIMLGTNDTKFTINLPPYVIAHGIDRLIRKIKGAGFGPDGADPEILIAAPPHLGETIEETWSCTEFDRTSVAKDRELADYYKEAAARAGVHFVDTGALITADPADCVHMNEEGHARMADLVYGEIKSILG